MNILEPPRWCRYLLRVTLVRPYGASLVREYPFWVRNYEDPPPPAPANQPPIKVGCLPKSLRQDKKVEVVHHPLSQVRCRRRGAWGSHVRLQPSRPSRWDARQVRTALVLPALRPQRHMAWLFAAANQPPIMVGCLHHPCA